MHMPLPRDSFDDDQLIRHLLGALPENEAQRLEEESIVDDNLAARLQLVEDDLVDAYARGALTGARLARFESFYLASPRRREKAEFAKRFLATVDSANGQPQPARAAAVAGRHALARWLPWTLATAATLSLATGVLLVRDARLRRDVTDARGRISAAEQRTNAVSGQLEDQQRATAAARQALADARGTQPPAAVALVLMPQTRGVDPAPILAVSPGANTVPLDLKIDAASAAQYDVTLRDPATNGIVWRSPPLTSEPLRRPPVVPVRVPTGLLKSQHYALDLFELRAGGAPEFVGSYAFEVVRP
jgi:hypothetical protein